MSKIWIPSLPQGWSIGRLRHISQIFAGGTPDRKNLDLWFPGDVPWLNSGSVNQDVVMSPSDFVSQKAAASGATRWVPRNSVIVALAGQGRTKGMAARTAIDATLNQSLAAIVPSAILDFRYLHYWLKANYRNIRGLAGGDLRDGLNLQHIGSIYTPLPELVQQRFIAEFLDRETAEIDAFIADQERLIELLEERRAATITHAVTKGLDPDAPMKDSGSKEIGTVPLHWNVSRLKWGIIKIESGTSVNATDVAVSASHEVGVLKTSCVYTGEFDPTENKTVNDEDLQRVSCLVRADTLIVSRMNTPQLVGAAGYTSREESNIYLPDRLWQVYFHDSWETQFIHFWTQTPLYRMQIEAVSMGTSSSMKNIGQDDFRNLVLHLPPRHEQRTIAHHLIEKTAEFDAAVADAREAIVLSRERRAALISAAVTGQLDVSQSQRPVDEVSEEEQGVWV